MDLGKAFKNRENLDEVQLERLLQGLRDQVDLYKVSIKNYPPERMEKYGTPYLTMLVGRVKEVENILRNFR